MYQVSTLTIGLMRYPDGCVILDGVYSSANEELTFAEKYHAKATSGEILRCLARYIEGYETGTLNTSDLWDQLQLPLDKDGAERYTENR